MKLLQLFYRKPKVGGRCVGGGEAGEEETSNQWAIESVSDSKHENMNGV